MNGSFHFLPSLHSFVFEGPFEYAKDMPLDMESPVILD